METNMALSLYDFEPTGGKSEAEVFALVEAETQRLALLFTDFSDASALSQIAGNRGDTLEIHPEVAEVLQSALEMSTASQGLFDFTLHDLKWAWGLSDPQNGRIPSQAELDSLLRENPTYQKAQGASPELSTAPVTLLPNHRALLHRTHTRLDLGGIAKGYIVDRLHRMLDSLGYPIHLLQSGGEIRVGGRKSGQRPWIIGIRHPRIADSLCGTLTSADPLAVSTSGDYERFFIQDGKRYHHVFDPRTGSPATGTVAVTVVADSSRQTDALTKPLFIMGPDSGMAFARTHGAKAIWFLNRTEASPEAGADALCAVAMPELAGMLKLNEIPACAGR